MVRQKKSVQFFDMALADSSHWVDPSKRDNVDEQIDNLGLKNKTFLTTISRLEPMKYIEHVIYTVESQEKDKSMSMD